MVLCERHSHPTPEDVSAPRQMVVLSLTMVSATKAVTVPRGAPVLRSPVVLGPASASTPLSAACEVLPAPVPPGGSDTWPEGAKGTVEDEEKEAMDWRTPAPMESPGLEDKANLMPLDMWPAWRQSALVPMLSALDSVDTSWPEPEVTVQALSELSMVPGSS